MTNIKKTSSNDMFEMMDKAYKFAEILSSSDIVPSHYRNKPANCFIAVQTAYRMNMDPMLVMQNTYVVSGKLGMNTAFAISLANNSGIFENGIRYKLEGTGENMKATAYAILKKGGDEISYTFTFAMAKAEGYTRNPKYRTMPDLMLRYRAATLLIRTHVPEVINGMHTVDELEDVKVAEEAKHEEPKTNIIADKLREAASSYENPTSLRLEQIEVEKHPEPVNEEHEADPEEQALYQRLVYLIGKYMISQDIIGKWCSKAGVEFINELDKEKIQQCINYIEEKYEQD
jgi:hypothetical protein